MVDYTSANSLLMLLKIKIRKDLYFFVISDVVLGRTEG